MKDPDGAYDCVRETARKIVKEIAGLTAEERLEIEESRAEELDEFAARWMKYGEYLTVEFDTDAGTATVVPTE